MSDEHNAGNITLTGGLCDNKNIKIVNELLDTYKRFPKSELEIRFRDVNREIFDSFYLEISKNKNFQFHEIEQSLNIISENVFNTSSDQAIRYIRQQIYKNGEKIEDNLIQKKPLERRVKCDDFLEYTINLSSEEPSTPFNSKQDALVRFKNRASFIRSDTDDIKWRVDLTAVKKSKISDAGPNKTRIIEEFFNNLTKDNFTEELNYGNVNSFEIEIEFKGKPEKLTYKHIEDITKEVLVMINKDYVQESQFSVEIQRAAKFILDPSKLGYFKGNLSLKRLLNKVTTLTINNYMEIFPPDGYFLTEKADGVHALVIADEKKCNILTDKVTEVKFTNSQSASSELNLNQTLVCEGEYLEDKKLLLIFDVIAYDNKSLVDLSFSERIDYLDRIIKKLSKYGDNVEFRPKTFIRLDKNNLKDQFSAVYAANYDYSIDGLIIISPDTPYSKTKTYKWKPIEKNTIDFLIIECPKKLLGIAPYLSKPGYKLFLLFVGISFRTKENLGLTFLPYYSDIFPNNATRTERARKDGLDDYFPIQFCPANNPYDYLYYHSDSDKNYSHDDLKYNIVEMIKDKNFNWQIVRIRHDRKLEKNFYGNDFVVAETNYFNYSSPLEFKHLHSKPDIYFEKTRDESYKASNGMRRFVISKLILNNFSNSELIVDLAIGRGADLTRYILAGVKKLIGLDIDAAALAELNKRKIEILNDPKKFTKSHKLRQQTFKNLSSMLIHTHAVDLTTKYDLVLKDLEKFGNLNKNVDGIICNFAFHYFCGNIKNVRNIVKLVSSMLKIGKVFIFTVLNGKAVFDLLADVKTGDSYKFMESGRIKYEIKKLYSGKDLADFGQKISVRLPFSEELYEEPICNLDAVCKEFKSDGFSLELSESFADKLDEFKSANSFLYEQLSKEDKQYIGLHQFVSLRKMKK